jgi:DNA-binding CsgD family transcriptional regulator
MVAVRRRVGRGSDARLIDEIDRVVDALPPPAFSHVPGRPGEVVAGFAAATTAERSRGVGDNDPALWRVARETWLRLDRRVHALYAAMRLAEALAEQATAAEAQSVLAATDKIAADIGLRALRADLTAIARRHRLRMPTVEAAENPLTARELDVLSMIAAGHTNAEIGRELLLSTSTIRVHTSNILRKLSVTTRAEATAVAYRRGLLQH